jgi:hypothetical protein
MALETTLATLMDKLGVRISSYNGKHVHFLVHSSGQLQWVAAAFQLSSDAVKLTLYARNGHLLTFRYPTAVCTPAVVNGR